MTLTQHYKLHIGYFIHLGVFFGFANLFSLPTGKYVIHVYARGPKFPYTKYGGLERPHKLSKYSYPT